MAVFALSAAALTVPYAHAAELLERAVLPSATFSPGPTSGQYATGSNGVATPFINRQPVQGFSAVLRGPDKGAGLMNIYDPRDVAADGRTRTVFTLPFQTIEDLLVLDNNRLLVINDSNYPGSAGREFGVPDNDEFIVIHTAPLLGDEDCRDDHGDGRGPAKRDDQEAGIHGRDRDERDRDPDRCRLAE
jgi:hypothetical protein